MDQAELFSSSGGGEVDAGAPLAARMRPRTFDEFVGQAHLVAPASALRRQLAGGAPPSLILWGPPGTGKTTLARLVARASGAHLVTLSAVTSGVADVRRAVQAASDYRRAHGRPTVLFIDEIHRFNRAQQDALLPHVEAGRVALIGATTENPSFSVTGPLLSRCRVHALHPLTADEVRSVVESALTDPERGLAGRVEVSPEALDALVALSAGDARTALNALEAAAQAAAEGARLGAGDIQQAAQRTILYDRAGDQHHWVISAYIKSLRDSDPDGAIYWLARLLEAGEDPMFVARRLTVLAGEDVGLADPQALVVAQAAQSATSMIGMPECVYPLSAATLYVALAPKSNSAATAYWAAAQSVRERGALPVPAHLRNAVTSLDREMGAGRGYVYAHDQPEAAGAQAHLPEAIAGTTFYQPRGLGREPELSTPVEEFRERLRQSRGL
ncbi:MAG: replication-associated recombination protein A [Candidatus Dormibacteria bacterium]